MTAEEALRFNFVSRVFADRAELNKIVWPMIEGYSELPIGSLRATKKLMRQHNLSVEELMAVNKKELDVLSYRLLNDNEVVEAAMKFLSRKNKL